MNIIENLTPGYTVETEAKPAACKLVSDNSRDLEWLAKASMSTPYATIIEDDKPSRGFGPAWGI